MKAPCYITFYYGSGYIRGFIKANIGKHICGENEFDLRALEISDIYNTEMIISI